MWSLPMPIARLAYVEQALLELPGSPFLGGTLAADVAGGVPAARVRKWAQIKGERERRINAAGVTSVATFDTDEASQAKLTSAATLLIANPGLTSMRFTCADNVRRTFTRAEFMAAASQVGAAVQAIYDTADTLRAAIDAASSVGAVEAISWPS
jgi:hypothetical protein